MSKIREDQTNEAFDLLESALVQGWQAKDGKWIAVDDLAPLMDAARALLMLHRGVEPIMPKASIY